MKYGVGGATFIFAHTGEVQPPSANLTSISALTGANNRAVVFTGPGATITYTKPSCSGANQAVNWDAVNHIENCVTIATSGISGGVAGAFSRYSSATTLTPSTVLSESAGNIIVAGGLIVGSGPGLLFNTAAITPSDITWTVLNFSGTVRPSTGALTPGNIVTTNANGLLIDGGSPAAGGTWTDSSTNTGSNKTLVAVGAGGTNILTVPIAPYWSSGSLVLPSGSTCTLAAVAAINSGPSIDAVNCTDAATSTFEGNVILRQSLSTATFTLAVSDIDSSSHVFGGNFSAMCRASGTSINATWGTAQSVAVTMTTANNNVTGTTAAVSPNGTCSAGSTLFWRFVVNTATFTDGGNARVIGVLMNQAS